jgi:ApaG protein
MDKLDHNILVKAIARYELNHSSPKLNKYVHSYHITIENNGLDTVQLISRHWIIVNAYGETREVQGMGVIGKQPIINPGGKYEYDSWSPMNTDIGKMYGSFDMLRISDNTMIRVEIPEFSLNADTVYN